MSVNQTLPQIVEGCCAACNNSLAVPFLSPTRQPLATIAWPESRNEAEAMPRLALDFVRCLACGHIYNRSFDYSDVPYSSKPNLMFNNGRQWCAFIEEIQRGILDRLPKNPVVVEVGHGDGSFLASLANLCPAGTFIGFDPNGVSSAEGNLRFVNSYFTETEFADLAPDMVIGRHVLEHMKNPLKFIQRLSLGIAETKRSVSFYFESPCVDRVLETNRTVDFYYEHISHFTTSSFSTMFSAAKARGISIIHGYDGEVIGCFGQFALAAAHHSIVDETNRYRAAADRALATIPEHLSHLVASGDQVAVWGGTGKSAAFMCRYGMDADHFPLVIDSDARKSGTFVPGTGQRIEHREILKNRPPATIIVPSQWRARDIRLEIRSEGIPYNRILIEHDGRLVDFENDHHPYTIS